MGEETSIDSDGGDGDSEAIQACYEWSRTPPSIAVTKTTAIAANCDTAELTPLYETIDPESIDEIIDPNVATRADAPCSISFTYVGYHVTIRSTGDVRVQPEIRE